MPYTLTAHPDYPAPSDFEVEVDIDPEGNGLSLIYALVGNDREVLIQPGRDGGRHDALWKHTCFEVFVRCGADQRYVELNFAPTGEWAAYTFECYRDGMRNLPIAGQRFAFRGSRKPWWETGRWWSFNTGDILNPNDDWHIGLAAVIEAKDGSRSYWALEHAPGAPDFHNPACFKLRFISPPGA